MWTMWINQCINQICAVLNTFELWISRSNPVVSRNPGGKRIVKICAILLRGSAGGRVFTVGYQ